VSQVCLELNAVHGRQGIGREGTPRQLRRCTGAAAALY
jgi:hypothetical protein